MHTVIKVNVVTYYIYIILYFSGISTIIEKASGVAGGSSGRKQNNTNTNFSTVIEAPGVDTVELH